ncbi:MAG: hypothetical protein JST92_19715, partial [Deltaproteobacteria bacterium]|nr:hypothetical protein [Deltaproteobacteria bacterium]
VSLAIAPSSSVGSPLALRSFQDQELDIASGAAQTADNQNDPSQEGYCPARFHTDFTYAWRLSNAPPDGQASISDPSGTTTSFSARSPGAYAVQATASAGSKGSVTATAYLSVSSCGSKSPVVQSTAVSVGGLPSPRPPVGSLVAITATASSPDSTNGCGDPAAISYEWSLISAPAGSQASVASQDGTGVFSFTADAAGTYVFSVVAKDANGLVSSPVSVAVPTGACGPSVPAFTVSQVDDTAQVGNEVTLTAPDSSAIGTSQTCVPGNAYTYSWRIVSRPSASSASVDAVSGAVVHFTPDASGDYVIELTVTDAGGFSTQVTQVLKQASCTAAPQLADPIATGPDNQSGVVYRGDPVSVSIPSITPGSCGSKTSIDFTYSWALVSKPGTSNTSLSSNTVASPGFVADVAGGTYQLAVQVRDGLGNVSPPKFVSVSVSACGSQAPSVSVSPQTTSQTNFAPVLLTATATSPDNQNDPQLSGFCPARFNKTLSYQWSVVSAPVGAKFSLGGATTEAATLAPNTKGGYQVQLVVTDSGGLAATPRIASVNVTCGDSVPTALDVGATPAFKATQALTNITQKTASGTTTGPLTLTSSTLAAAPIKFYPGSPVKLTANPVDTNFSCGFTPQTLTYQWSFTSVPLGSQVAFDSGSAAQPSFVPDQPGDYFIELTLTDSAGQSGTQVFTRAGAAVISVSDCGSQTPVAQIGLDAPASPAPTATIGAVNGFAVILDGAASFSPDNAPVDFTLAAVAGCGLNKPLTYRWQFVSVPPGAQSVTFNDPTRVTPSFTPSTSGTYVVSLNASDGTRTSQAANVAVVTAEGAAGNLDYVAPQGLSTIAAGLHHFRTFRIPAGAEVTLPAGSNGTLDLVVSGDVYIGGTFNFSGSPGNDGPNGDVSWVGSGGGDTGYPYSNHGTPAPGGGCPQTGAISRSVGGTGSQ